MISSSIQKPTAASRPPFSFHPQMSSTTAVASRWMVGPRAIRSVRKLTPVLRRIATATSADISSSSEANKGLDFEYRPHEYIPLAVTINSYGGPPTTVINAEGAWVAADQNGNCCHLAGVITD